MIIVNPEECTTSGEEEREEGIRLGMIMELNYCRIMLGGGFPR